MIGPSAGRLLGALGIRAGRRTRGRSTSRQFRTLRQVGRSARRGLSGRSAVGTSGPLGQVGGRHVDPVCGSRTGTPPRAVEASPASAARSVVSVSTRVPRPPRHGVDAATVGPGAPVHHPTMPIRRSRRLVSARPVWLPLPPVRRGLRPRLGRGLRPGLGRGLRPGLGRGLRPGLGRGLRPGLVLSPASRTPRRPVAPPSTSPPARRGRTVRGPSHRRSPPGRHTGSARPPVPRPPPSPHRTPPLPPSAPDQPRRARPGLPPRRPCRGPPPPVPARASWRTPRTASPWSWPPTRSPAHDPRPTLSSAHLSRFRPKCVLGQRDRLRAQRQGELPRTGRR
ncbi:hypothetical protein EES45_19055 [Streptomyces sp. ADI97-07]|nr:hypothetical protein EES45_19055 [Streptomyces sp. ADI97-07]